MKGLRGRPADDKHADGGDQPPFFPSGAGIFSSWWYFSAPSFSKLPLASTAKLYQRLLEHMEA